MFFFNISQIPFLIFALFAIFYAPILIILGKLKARSLGGIVNILWGLILGIGAIYLFHSECLDNPYRGMMADEKNLVALLEHGKTIEGKVLKRWYYDGRGPKGWMIFYSFEAPNPKDDKLGIYYGRAGASGLYSTYSTLNEGDAIALIYYPAKPEINSEIYELLNGYQRILEEAGKLKLLDKFRDRYRDEFKNYPYIQLYEESKRKQ